MDKSEELSNAQKIVKKILTECPLARNDDKYLYMKVMEELNPKARYMPFCEVMFNLRELGLPLYSTISRARRDIQAKNEELKGNPKAQEARAELEEAYRDFFRS